MSTWVALAVWRPAAVVAVFVGLSACASSDLEPEAPSPASMSFDAPLVPDRGQVLFFMGQDSETLEAYKTAVLDPDPSAPRPGGVTLYTGIALEEAEDVLRGLRDTVDYGAGAISFGATLAAYPDAALAIGLALTDPASAKPSATLRALGGVTGEDVIDGDVALARGHVETLLDILEDLERDVFLRIGYEFDGPWNRYQPAPYTAAFRYIADRIQRRGLDRVATVWQSAAAPTDDGPYSPKARNHFDRWYPGDDVVDWVGLSVFNPLPRGTDPWGCTGAEPSPIDPAEIRDRILAFARARRKPVMIGEAAPQGFETDTPTAGCYAVRSPVPVSIEQVWETWYAPFFDVIETNRDVVRAVAYINTDWNRQAMWRCDLGASAGTPGCPSGYWGDSRVEGHPEILRRFQAELRKGIYVQP